MKAKKKRWFYVRCFYCGVEVKWPCEAAIVARADCCAARARKKHN